MALQLLERSLKRSRSRAPSDDDELDESDEMTAEEANEEELSTSSAMWRMDLAERLGMSEHQMLASMPSIELTRWQAKSFVQRAQQTLEKLYRKTS